MLDDDDNNRVGNVLELESAYVFAGGTKDCTVRLYDLRMTGSESLHTSRIVQTYQPRALANKSVSKDVSVSGIDVSKNKRELLVSYESDHIYTCVVSVFADTSTRLLYEPIGRITHMRRQNPSHPCVEATSCIYMAPAPFSFAKILLPRTTQLLVHRGVIISLLRG
jgi:hypothetical protein